jgi:signal peptidase II
MKSLLLWVALPLYLLDQATKAAILLLLAPGAEIPVLEGIFNIVHVHNTGAAFGMLKGANMLFAALSVAAIAAVALFVRKGAFRDTASRLAAALLLSGVAGNLTDRLIHGHVIDFLDVILPVYGHWPAFNVADSCICIAAALFVFSAFTEKRAAPPEETTA